MKHHVKMLSLLIALFLMLGLGAAQGQMNLISDEDLATVYGAGFSSFTLVGGISRADFNINTSTYTEIDSVKLGYYDDGTNNDYGFGANGEGWDEDWTNVKLGTSTQDLVCKGLYIEAKFTNISNPATRALEYIRVGTPDMTGDITANFNRFSGYIDDGDSVPEYNGYRLNTIGPGAKTITSTNSGFYISLENNATHTGYWVYFDNAKVN